MRNHKKSELKITALLFILILTFGCGTDQGKGRFNIYTIKNESGKDIKIKAYRTLYPASAIPNIIHLNDGEELTKTYQDFLPPRGYDFSAFFQGDSVVVLFDNSKIQKYTIFDGLICDQNPLFRSPFCETGSPIQTFIFTVEDYENAEDCNGNCE